MTVLPLTVEQTTEYNNVATTPPTAPLGDIINELTTGSASGGAALLWRPGGTAGGIVGTTWAEMEALLAAQDPKLSVTVYVDTSIAPAVVPSSANTDLDGRVTFSPYRFAVGTLVEVTVADGGVLRNFLSIRGPLSVRGAPTVQPFIVQEHDGAGIILRESGNIELSAGATAPAVQINGQFSEIASFEAGNITSSAGPGQPIVRLANGVFFIFAGIVKPNPAVVCPAQTFQGDATGVFVVLFDASAAPPAQTFYLGTVIPLEIDLAQDIMPSAGTTAARPSVPFLSQPRPGQMYFDTDIGKPVWWDGAMWVDATGAPA